MICPHCFKTIDDGLTFCPHCHGYVGEHKRSEFVFCEGCGARLSLHDRTCPKCGRPAPGILSTDSSSSDLAAGKTASFPRLTKNMIQTETPMVEPVSAARALDDSVDPSTTNVLPREELDEPRRKRGRRARPEADEDPYHPRRRSYKGLVIALVLLALVGGGAAFVVNDPLGVMPSFYAAFREAAREAFPSRQVAEDGTVGNGATLDDQGQEGSEPRELTDDEVFAQLNMAYDSIVAYGSEDAIGEVIDAFNGYYLASDRAVREQRSQSAYSLRDAVQQTIDTLSELKPPSDTAYTEDIEHLKSLADWMYGRVDAICQCWDVSLDVPEGESPSAYQDEILAPLRSAGSTDLDNYNAYLVQWEPERK